LANLHAPRWRRRMAEGLAGCMERLMKSKEPFA